VKPLFETRVDWIVYSGRQPGYAPVNLGYLADAPELRGLIMLQAGDVTDTDLECIGKLDRLTKLSFGGTNITNKGLLRLSSLQQLEYLWFGAREFDDDGLRCLSRMQN